MLLSYFSFGSFLHSGLNGACDEYNSLITFVFIELYISSNRGNKRGYKITRMSLTRLQQASFFLSNTSSFSIAEVCQRILFIFKRGWKINKALQNEWMARDTIISLGSTRNYLPVYIYIYILAQTHTPTDEKLLISIYIYIYTKTHRPRRTNE